VPYSEAAYGGKARVMQGLERGRHQGSVPPRFAAQSEIHDLPLPVSARDTNRFHKPWIGVPADFQIKISNNTYH
jgi:hypothetical protein